MENYFIGIDVSKKKLDVCLLHQGKILEEEVIANHGSAITSYLVSLFERHGIPKKEALICAEHTGLYTYPLSCCCVQEEFLLWIENPAQIKYCSGMQRGKNDKTDARKIAIYASRYCQSKKIYSLPEREIEEIKRLSADRALLVVDRAKYKAQLSDQRDYVKDETYRTKHTRLSHLIKAYDRCIAEIEAEIDELISNHSQLRRQLELLCSVDGIGPITAIKMIVETNAFTAFDDPRKFCCYAGVAPFSYTSGSSIRSRTKLSHKADKSIKSLLQTAAIGAIKKKGELWEYYNRKIDQGKEKMCVYNAVRAKLVYRMFAVIRKDQPYEKFYLKSIA